MPLSIYETLLQTGNGTKQNHLRAAIEGHSGPPTVTKIRTASEPDTRPNREQGTTPLLAPDQPDQFWSVKSKEPQLWQNNEH